MVTVKLRYVVEHHVKGRIYFYFRRGKLYQRLPDYYKEPERFHRKYAALLGRVDTSAKEPTVPGSFGSLCERYLASSNFKSKAELVQKGYRYHLDAMRVEWSDLPVNRLTRKGVMAYKDRLHDKPRKAHAAMQVLRLLLNYAIDIGLLTVNPALRPGKPKSKQYAPWSDQAITTFRETNEGNTTMLLALDLALYTGQRRGDIVKMTSADYDGTQIKVTQGKTGEPVWIPVHRDLKARLDAREKHFMLLTTPRGKSFTPTHLTRLFHGAVVKAGLNGLAFHGLRVTAAIKLAEAGCTEAELQAILGHRTVAMAAYYRRQANKQVQAKAAIHKLERSKV
jgi:integrase